MTIFFTTSSTRPFRRPTPNGFRKNAQHRSRKARQRDQPERRGRPHARHTSEPDALHHAAFHAFIADGRCNSNVNNIHRTRNVHQHEINAVGSSAPSTTAPQPPPITNKNRITNHNEQYRYTPIFFADDNSTDICSRPVDISISRSRFRFPPAVTYQPA